MPFHIALLQVALEIVPGTGRIKGYDNLKEIACPKPCEAFHGQDTADYPTGRGPQGNAIRISNFARMVR
jgi:hypothetical protein